MHIKEEKIMLNISKQTKNLLTVVVFLGLVSAQSVVTFDLDGVDECGFLSVTGTWDGWSGWGANTDTGMAADIPAGDHEFVILCVNTSGEWWVDIWASSTVYYAPIDGSCWNGNAEYPNYLFNVDGSGDSATISYCAGTCNASCTIEGCTDETALNYNPDANADDGSCEYFGDAPGWAGAWRLAPEANALMVGPEPNDGTWWANSAADVDARACLFDDEYVFGEDGSFNNELGSETWLEGWQGVAEGCGAPVAPHDGSADASYAYDDATVTVYGTGAFLGLAKVYNGGECSSPDDAAESITYDITLSDNDETMTVLIHFGGGYWTFKLKTAESIDNSEIVWGCLDSNATNYDETATDQLLDQWGNLVCVYASCDDVPYDGCMYADAFAGWNEFFGPDDCTTYGGTPCEGGGDLSSVVTFDLDGLDGCGFVSVTGTWDGWSGWGAHTDSGMAADIPAGDHEFIILCVNTEGEWWNDIWGSSTVYNAPIDGSCWNGNSEYPNYVLNVDGSGDAVTVSYCAGSCDADCPAADPCADVTCADGQSCEDGLCVDDPEPDTGVVFSGAFGGTGVDGNTYTNPTGSEGWAGFANEDTDLYPFSFSDGGEITFTGATAGTDADVYFRFEYNPYPDTEPSFNTAAVTVSGTDEASYSVEIPAQGANTFSSFLLYVTTLDAPVTLTNVAVNGG